MVPTKRIQVCFNKYTRIYYALFAEFKVRNIHTIRIHKQNKFDTCLVRSGTVGFENDVLEEVNILKI